VRWEQQRGNLLDEEERWSEDAVEGRVKKGKFTYREGMSVLAASENSSFPWESKSGEALEDCMLTNVSQRCAHREGRRRDER